VTPARGRCAARPGSPAGPPCRNQGRKETVENQTAGTEEVQRESQGTAPADFDPNVVIFACRH